MFYSRISGPSVTYSLFMAFLFIFCAESSSQIDSALKKEVIEKVADYMDHFYYSPELGAQMATHIRQLHKDGAYDLFTEVKPFCKKVTSDLRDICHDKHIFVFYSPEEAKEVAARNNLLPTAETKQIKKKIYQRSRFKNFGFVKLEILDGNIGYLDIRQFSNPIYSAETAVSAMNFLANSDAVIIDLRKNGGGSGEMVQLLSSYFFEGERVPMSFSHYRKSDETIQMWTLPHVPGKRLIGTDLYILTSSRTFSAAEEFAYNMKHLKRGTIVGEATKGGAHPVEVKIVRGDILTQISIGSSFHPLTQQNWESVGVQPNVKSSEKSALKTAYRLALETLMKKADDQAHREKLQAVLNDL
jgi:hypothetical protein